MASTYDLVVFGATSFVGQILVGNLQKHANDNSDFAWAIAGRSESRLNDVKKALGLKAADLPVIVTDASDENALRAMCEQTKVVVSTVGPYALYGSTLVKVCAETGTDYCDLTGEAQWIKKMITEHEATAKASGARIVNCCGFDSIPSDLGVYHLQQNAKQQFSTTCNHISMRVKAAKGGFSGGTVTSIVNAVKEAMADPAVRKIMADPYSICPEGHPYKARQFNQKSAVLDTDFNRWTAPFVMAPINTRVVFRSNALQDNDYGKDFTYNEAILTGKGVKGRMTAITISASLGAFVAATMIKPSRWLLENYMLPKPGEGPTPEEQEKGFYDLRFIGKTTSGNKIWTKVTGDRDPGYGSTSKMLGQAAICLAKDISREEKAGGFWTPASIFGQKLVDRLEKHAGVTFEVINDAK
ncbi:MAG: saccharopine dehydrogenase [Gammaproteobacteria bacterium]|nr:MAG: saccharopine dehydrogenase [Gammaproteobacteria bacterium]